MKLATTFDLTACVCVNETRISRPHSYHIAIVADDARVGLGLHDVPLLIECFDAEIKRVAVHHPVDRVNVACSCQRLIASP